MRAMKSDTRINTLTRVVTVEGIRPIMFDRYPGDNDTRLAWHSKIYLAPGTSVVSLPVINISSFYTAHNTNSAPKRLCDKRKFKDIALSILSFTTWTAPDGGDYVPFTRNGVPVEVGEFGIDEDPRSGVFLHRAVARLDKGVPNPQERPVLPLPWSLTWHMTIMENDAIKEAEIYRLTVQGGLAIGFGTFRGMFGKFKVTRWDNLD